MLIWGFSGCKLSGLPIDQSGWEGIKISLFTGVTPVWLSSFLLLFLAACLLDLYVSSKNQYKRLFLSNPTPMWIYDQKTLRKVAVNNAAIFVYGYSRKEFEAMHILDIVNPDDHFRVDAMTKEVTGDYNARGIFELLKKTGEPISVNITSHKIRFKQRSCVMVMCEDVTLQVLQDKKLQSLHQAEKAYQKELECKIKELNETLQEKQRLAEVIDRIHNMVIITDTSGVISWVNEAFIQTTG
jgi:PAS domain S-box-containing protein